MSIRTASILIVTFALGLSGAVLAQAKDGVNLPDFEREKLPNGTVVLLAEKPGIPLVGFTAILRGGAVTDPEKRAGTSYLLAELLTKGAGKRDALEFATTLESLGGQIEAGAGLESLFIEGSFLSKDVDLMVELVRDMLLSPTLDESEFDKIKNRSIQSIKAAKDGDPRGLISNYGAAFLFDDHPYGSPVRGSERTLANIDHGDLEDYYRDHLGGDRLIISVVGDFDKKSLLKSLRRSLGGWRAAAKPLPNIPKNHKTPNGQVLLVNKPGATQTYFWLGQKGVPRAFPERPELMLSNTIFGGRFTSMLNTELRVKSGLTYGARSQMVRPSQTGSLAIVSYTETDKTEEAVDLALKTLGEFKTKGLNSELLASAQNYIAGQFPPDLETSGQIARQLATLEFYELPASYVNDYVQDIRRVELSQTRSVINRIYPEAKDLVYVFIGDAERIRDKVEKYGDLKQLELSDPDYRP